MTRRSVTKLTVRPDPLAVWAVLKGPAMRTGDTVTAKTTSRDQNATSATEASMAQNANMNVRRTVTRVNVTVKVDSVCTAAALASGLRCVTRHVRKRAKMAVTNRLDSVSRAWTAFMGSTATRHATPTASAQNVFASTDCVTPVAARKASTGLTAATRVRKTA